MYKTCLFCNRDLGTNEAIEGFQIGRRLAYDPAKGRLWVVCARCERWNLTPLESRWEAIEEAERAFRASRLRVSTDNIGMAQLKEGLELVRIGAPPKLELAGWRYGDQFGRRRLKTIGAGVAITAAMAAYAGGQIVTGGAIGLLGSLGFQAVQWRLLRADRNVARARVADDAGSVLHLTREDMRGAGIVRVPEASSWMLKFCYHNLVSESKRSGLSRIRANTIAATTEARLSGDSALRAMTRMLPYINASGGAAGQVRDAVAYIEETPTLTQMINSASNIRLFDNRIVGENRIGALPHRMRLGLEMVLHESDEQRAMEGTLSELESRWREAEEIAAIADALLLPAEIEEKLQALRNRAARG